MIHPTGQWLSAHSYLVTCWLHSQEGPEMLLASLREALTPLPRSLMLALDLLEKGWIWAEGQAGEAVSAPAPFFFF